MWNSNRTAHPQRLSRALQFQQLQQVEVLYYPGSEQQRRWSDYADAQADLRLCCSHMAKTDFLMTWLKYDRTTQDKVSRKNYICFYCRHDEKRVSSFTKCSVLRQWILSCLKSENIVATSVAVYVIRVINIQYLLFEKATTCCIKFHRKKERCWSADRSY